MLPPDVLKGVLALTEPSLNSEMNLFGFGPFGRALLNITFFPLWKFANKPSGHANFNV